MAERWQEVSAPPDFLPDTVGDWRLESPWVLVYEADSETYLVAKFVAYPDEDDPDPHWVQIGRDAYDCQPTHWMYLPTPPTEE